MPRSDAIVSEVASRRGLEPGAARLWGSLLVQIGLLATLPPAPLHAQEGAATQGGLESLIEAFPRRPHGRAAGRRARVTDDAALRAALRERLLAEMAARDAAIAPGAAETAPDCRRVANTWKGRPSRLMRA